VADELVLSNRKATFMYRTPKSLSNVPPRGPSGADCTEPCFKWPEFALCVFSGSCFDP
jgi:hypothetical protein